MQKVVCSLYGSVKSKAAEAEVMDVHVVLLTLIQNTGETCCQCVSAVS